MFVLMRESPAPYIDHTLLRADATEKSVRQLCREAVTYGFASVCVPPALVSAAVDVLAGTDVAVGSVVGFPLGYLPTDCKLFETEKLVQDGADEIDMVINISFALDRKFEEIGREIRRLVDAAGEAMVKVILECCYLDNRSKEMLTELAVDAGASFVKTSTGFGPGGATLDDVRLLVHAAAGRAGVKAAGGIRSWEHCRSFLEAGATRIGTSNGSAIMGDWRAEAD
jgi:deoxyribose-phosphate aldolase